MCEFCQFMCEFLCDMCVFVRDMCEFPFDMCVYASFENGAGKTTILKSIVGIHLYDHGEIILNIKRIHYCRDVCGNC